MGSSDVQAALATLREYTGGDSVVASDSTMDARHAIRTVEQALTDKDAEIKSLNVALSLQPNTQAFLAQAKHLEKAQSACARLTAERDEAEAMLRRCKEGCDIDRRILQGLREDDNIRAEAAEAEVARLRDELEWAKSEINYTHDRGDHLVYRDEWEAFDRWQRERGKTPPAPPVELEPSFTFKLFPTKDDK